MTTSFKDPQRRARASAWALEKLELTSGARLSDARTALLRAIEEEEFVPWGTHVEAYEVLRTPPGESPVAGKYEAFLAAEEEQLAERVESFTQMVFESPPQVQLQQWDRLMAAGQG